MVSDVNRNLEKIWVILRIFSISLRRDQVDTCVVCLSDVPVLNGLLNSTETKERHGETMLTQVLIVHFRLDISDVRAQFTDVTV